MSNIFSLYVAVKVTFPIAIELLKLLLSDFVIYAVVVSCHYVPLAQKTSFVTLNEKEFFDTCRKLVLVDFAWLGQAYRKI